MLSSKDQKNIKSKFNKIYKKIYKSKDLDIYSNEIIDIIKKSNKVKKSKKKIKIDEKTALVICYADSVLETNKPHTLKAFKSFYKKYLKNCFNTVHFLPFYPSSSDSGFAVKDHYKIDKKYGNWGDINSFSKNNLIMADVVINHASSRGLWFKNYLKMKSPGRGYFFTIDNKFNTSKVVRPREHKLLKKINEYWETIKSEPTDYNQPASKVKSIGRKVKDNLKNNDVFGMCPVASEKTVCCNLMTIDAIQGCTLGCSYCSIQTFYSDGKVAVETNLADKLNELELDPKKNYHIGSGQSSDSLALGNRAGRLLLKGRTEISGSDRHAEGTTRQRSLHAWRQRNTLHGEWRAQYCLA